MAHHRPVCGGDVSLPVAVSAVCETHAHLQGRASPHSSEARAAHTSSGLYRHISRAFAGWVNPSRRELVDCVCSEVESAHATRLGQLRRLLGIGCFAREHELEAEHACNFAEDRFAVHAPTSICLSENFKVRVAGVASVAASPYKNKGDQQYQPIRRRVSKRSSRCKLCIPQWYRNSLWYSRRLRARRRRDHSCVINRLSVTVCPHVPAHIGASVWDIIARETNGLARPWRLAPDCIATENAGHGTGRQKER